MRKFGLVVLLLSSSLLMASCKDPFGACEKAALDIGNGIAAGMKTVDGLRVAGQITPQEESNLLGYFKFANDANGAFGLCAQSAHTAGGKGGAFTACAQTFSQALTNPQELALIHVGNPQTQMEVQTLVNGISGGVAAVISALGGQ
jgi:hypothetical protein